jgi:sugar phosphate isomerase/epimerase
MNRRQFLHRSAWAAGALCTGLSVSACTSDDSDDATARADASASTKALVPALGLQLYTIRRALEEEVRGTMEQVAAIGYEAVEFAGYYGRGPEDINTLLNDLGLTSPAAHIPLERLRAAPEEVIRTAQAIGHEYVVCPYLAEEERTSIADYRRLATELSAFGRRCTDAGLTFAYHNHDFEFVDMDGTRPYDVLLAETDPEHVTMELDLYWVIAAGVDPLDYIRQNPARYPLCHIKDRSAEGEMVDVGSGTIDFPSIFSEADFEHYFVEHDDPENPMQSIEASYEALQALTR